MGRSQLVCQELFYFRERTEGRVTSVSRADRSENFLEREEVTNQLLAFAGEDAFRMKLHALDWQRAMP